MERVLYNTVRRVAAENDGHAFYHWITTHGAKSRFLTAVLFQEHKPRLQPTITS